IVDAGHDHQRDESQCHPDQLTPRQRAAPATGGQRPQRQHRQPDDEQSGDRDGPVDVLQEPPIETNHHESSPNPTMATFSRNTAWYTWRAIGAATWPPFPPRSTSTTTTICGSSAGANDANQAWSWPLAASL